MHSTRSSEPQATKSFVRILGAFLILGGAAIMYFGDGWSVDGLVPMRWSGVFFLALGALMEIAPERFRQRASRFYQIADQFSTKAQPKS
jgi:hypothetical protein